MDQWKNLLLESGKLVTAVLLCSALFLGFAYLVVALACSHPVSLILTGPLMLWISAVIGLWLARNDR